MFMLFYDADVHLLTGLRPPAQVRYRLPYH